MHVNVAENVRELRKVKGDALREGAQSLAYVPQIKYTPKPFTFVALFAIRLSASFFFF